MRTRFNRSGAGTVSFFAFQDIITAVTGILVIITVLLSLSLPDSPDAPSEDSRAETTELKLKLKGLLRRIAELRTASQSSFTTPQASPRALRMEVEMLELELAQLAAFNSAESRERASALDGSARDRTMASDLALEEADRRRLAAEVQQLREAAAANAAERQQADAEVRGLEAALLEELKRRSNLVLVRDHARTSKEPLVAIVSSDGVRIQGFDGGSPEQWRDAAAFGSGLSSVSQLDRYIVFYAKPSGVAQIEAYLEAARGRGFGVGYDAIPEDAEITLETGKTANP